MSALTLATVDTFRNQIVQCEALTLLRSLPDNSVHCMVTSPPYNLANTSGGGLAGAGKESVWPNNKLHRGYVGHNDNMPHDKYVIWQREVLGEMMRVIPDDGVIFYNHKWRVQNGLLQDRADIMDGFPVRQIIIWHRSGGINHSQRFFLPTYEVIYMIAKPGFKLSKGSHAYGDVWRINQTPSDHEAAFPLELARRCIESSGAKLVCDPFMGSGTTARAAQVQCVDWIGCDINPAHVDKANKRTQQAYTLPMFASADA